MYAFTSVILNITQVQERHVIHYSAIPPFRSNRTIIFRLPWRARVLKQGIPSNIFTLSWKVMVLTKAFLVIQGGSNMTGTNWLVYTQIVPVIFEPPCIFSILKTGALNQGIPNNSFTLSWRVKGFKHGTPSNMFSVLKAQALNKSVPNNIFRLFWRQRS
jgi:ribose 1,5-bisphosphokinase PhnN